MSLWIIDYKEPAAFKEDWKTKNLIGILLQRLRGEKADQNSSATSSSSRTTPSQTSTSSVSS